MKYKQFDNAIFTNGTTTVELPTTQCGDPVLKHECIYCCITTNTCNVAYIAYRGGNNLVDWFQLYNLREIDLISSANPSTVPEYWFEKWIQNGGQPTTSELAVFSKNFLNVALLYKTSGNTFSSSISCIT